MNARTIRLTLVVMVLAASCSDSGDGADGGGGGTATDPIGGPTGNPTTTVEDATAVPAGVNWSASSLAPPSEIGSRIPTFNEVTATAGVPAAPPGFPFRYDDYTRQLFPVSDAQFVTASCSCWEGGNSTGVFGGLRTPIYLFRSVDAGATWAQIDLFAALGDVNGRIDTIIDYDGAILLTATTSDAAGITPSVISVLRSTDGESWERLSAITSDAVVPAPVHSFDLYTVGSSLVLYGGDQACVFDGSSAIQNIGPAYQTRLWTSTDGGASWVAQSPVDSGLDGGRPPLPEASACEGLSFQDIMDSFGSSPRLITVANDQLMVWSGDGQGIVTTVDGLTWSSTTLQGAIALASDRAPEPVVNSSGSAILSIDDQFVAMNLEEYRNIDDTATGSRVGLSVVTWTSADGTSWKRQPLGRPIPTLDYSAIYQFFVADDRVALRAYNSFDEVEFGMYESVAGEAEDWTKCVAAAGANCAFSTEVGDFVPGSDLSGIDLSYASLEGRDLTDVSFEGARLEGTNLTDVTIQRNNFDGAELSNLQLLGDLSTSTFDGATLSGVLMSAEFLTIELTGATISSPRISIGDAGLPAGVSLVGRDLNHYSFTNGTLAGVDFSGANLTGATFSDTDLTGANFTGAILDGSFFFQVTCPDGQPITQEAFGPESCRL